MGVFLNCAYLRMASKRSCIVCVVINPQGQSNLVVFESDYISN